jgi:metal-responsive CopG/Arc/MetJ family transcriptional regulator
MRKDVVISISIRKTLLEKIDREKGWQSRSSFIENILRGKRELNEAR